MTPEQDKDYIFTADLSLATFLSLYYPVEAIDWQGTSKAFFCFKRNDDLDAQINRYWNRELRVEPQEFFDQLRNIKARLYAGR